MKVGAVNKALINAQTYNANTVVDITSVFQGIQWVTKPTFSVQMVEASGSSDVQIFIQTSKDGGTTKANVGQFTLRTGSGNETLINGNGAAANGTLFGEPWGEKVYANLAFNAAGGNWTVTLKAHGMALHGAGK